MKTNDFEERLRQHSQITKSVMKTPNINVNSEEITMVKKDVKFKRIAVLVAAVVCLVGTSVYAAIHLMNAKEVADSLGDKKLAGFLNSDENAYDTVSDGKYSATVLGIVSGENLSDFESSSWEIFAERTYAVVAVERTDGSFMTYDDEILVTPLIEGLSPWKYNIFSMNGGYVANIIDGVLYRIIEFDSVEYFADRNVYIAVVSEPFLNNNSYSFDEATGKISPKEDYDGTNILIKLNLDNSKADPEKAREYLDKLNEAVKISDDEPEDEGYIVAPDSESEKFQTEENGRFQIETDESEEMLSVVVTEK